MSEIKVPTFSDYSDSHLAGGRVPFLCPHIMEKIKALLCKSQSHKISSFED